MAKKLAVIAGLALAALRGRAFRPAGPPALAPAPADPVLVGAGDIASCSEDGDEQTAALLDKIDGTVFTLGDNVYPSGTAAPVQWRATTRRGDGTRRGRARCPETTTTARPGAAGYFGYFGGAAGDPATGNYSYDLGTWHIIVLNSNCGEIGGCGPGSRQERWLKADLAAHPAPCAAAMWHHPRYSSADHGDDSRHAAPLAGPLRRRRRARAFGPRPHLRALRPAGRRREAPTRRAASDSSSSAPGARSSTSSSGSTTTARSGATRPSGSSS